MIGTATFVMLIAATAIADNAYPPCTQQRTDKCSAQQQAPGPTLYIPCPKGEYCPPHDIPRPQEAAVNPLTAARSDAVWRTVRTCQWSYRCPASRSGATATTTSG